MQTNYNTPATAKVHQGTQMGIVELLRLSVLALGLSLPLFARLAHASDLPTSGPPQTKVMTHTDR